MIEDIQIEQNCINGIGTMRITADLIDIERISHYVEHMFDEPIMCVDEDAEVAEEDLVNHPSHYTNSGMECILEMVMLYGFEETMSFCKLNAHKYRKRAFHKGGKMDMDKSDWYIATYKDLSVALETGKTPIQYILSKMN